MMAQDLNKNEIEFLRIDGADQGVPMAAELIPLPEDLPDGMLAMQLAEKEILEKVKLVAREAVRTESVEDAKILISKLGHVEDLKSQKPELYPLYQHIIKTMSFLAVPAKKTVDIKEALKDDLLTAIKAGVDIQSKLDLVFVERGSEPEAYQALQKALASGIENNEQLIGNEQIVLKTEHSPVSPAIKNWLLDYNQATSGRAKTLTGVVSRGGVERATYLVQNNNVQKLNESDRVVLKKVLELYDWIWFAPKGVLSAEYKSLMSPRIGILPKIEPRLKSSGSLSAKAPVIASAVKPKPPKPAIPKAPPRPRFRQPAPISRAPRHEPHAELIRPLAPKAPSTPLNPPEPPSSVRPGRTPSPAGGEGQVNEALYRSTLDELNKMRQQYEGGRDSGDRQRGATSTKGLGMAASDGVGIVRRQTKPLTQTGRETVNPKTNSKAAPPQNVRRGSVSVNEAIIREGRNGGSDSGEISAGESEIDEKLGELKRKIGDGQ